MKQRRDILASILFIILSIVCGFATKDFVIGIPTLLTGLLCAWYTTQGKSFNYIMGFINYLLMAYTSYVNHLYGLFLFNTFIFAPFQLIGYFSWRKSCDANNTVISRKFTIKNSIIIIISCVLSSLLLGFVLSQIPGQRLSILDATSNCLNLCGIVLMCLRFKEGLWLWLMNNIADFLIWLFTFIAKGPNSTMMLLVSTGYLLLNIYSIYNWYHFKNKQEVTKNT